MGLLVAQRQYRGDFEERLKNLTEQVKQSGQIILFIDELHNLIGSGDAENASDPSKTNILKYAIAGGEFQVNFVPFN